MDDLIFHRLHGGNDPRLPIHHQPCITLMKKLFIIGVPAVFIALNLIRMYNKPAPRDYLKESLNEYKYQFQEEQDKARRLQMEAESKRTFPYEIVK